MDDPLLVEIALLVVSNFIATAGKHRLVFRALTLSSHAWRFRAMPARYYQPHRRTEDIPSAVILHLKPVTFHYKQELDPNNTPQFGLAAEDIER